MFKKYRFMIALVVISFVGISFFNTFGSSASTVFQPSGDTGEKVEEKKDDSINDQWRQLQRIFNYFNSKSQRSWDDRYTGGQSEEEYEKNEVTDEQVDVPAEPQEDTSIQKPNDNHSNGQYDALGEVSEFEQEVIRLTNQEREKYGLNPLEIDYELNRVAREKSRDMSVYNYFDHNSPIYGSPFDMMTSYGIQYRAAGENIAKGQRSPAEVVNAWMNSEGHRANILNGSFTHIGVGFLDKEHIWTQQFIGK